MLSKQDKGVVTVALGTAASTVIISMVLNTWAFTATLDGWFGHAVGILLPLWVLSLTYMGHRLWHVQTGRPLAAGCYALAGFALVVSLPHLANGYAQLGLTWWECWSLAVVTDLTQVAGKLLVITLYDKTCATQAVAEPVTKAVRQRKAKVEPQAAA